MKWTAPKRPVDHAEHALVTAILQNEFYVGAALPGERDLAVMLGVTRPTLREALRRLERDGWLTIQQGKATVVNDFWRDGGLNILSGIVQYSSVLPPNFIPDLLQVRLDLAPSYTRAAVEQAPESVLEVLVAYEDLENTPEAYAAFDWALQRRLTIASGNPVYALIFNSFAGFYEQLARTYFLLDVSRRASRAFYHVLMEAVQTGDAEKSAQITRDVMQQSIQLWQHSQDAYESKSQENAEEN